MYCRIIIRAVQPFFLVPCKRICLFADLRGLQLIMFSMLTIHDSVFSYRKWSSLELDCGATNCILPEEVWWLHFGSSYNNNNFYREQEIQLSGLQTIGGCFHFVRNTKEKLATLWIATWLLGFQYCQLYRTLILHTFCVDSCNFGFSCSYQKCQQSPCGTSPSVHSASSPQ